MTSTVGVLPTGIGRAQRWVCKRLNRQAWLLERRRACVFLRKFVFPRASLPRKMNGSLPTLDLNCSPHCIFK